jgi:mRNA interferase MazF
MPGKVSRGSVVEVNLDPTVGHEIRKVRPCVVIQNDIGNQNSPLIIVAALTGAEHIRKPPPIWVFVAKGDGGVVKDSYVLCHQIRTVDETRLGKIYGTLSKVTMDKVDRALRISLSLF